MKKETYTKLQRTLALLMALVMGFVLLPVDGLHAFAASGKRSDALGVVQTVDDPTTLTRPNDVFTDTQGGTVYGSTLNAGKILVGKTVTDGIVDGSLTPEALNLRSELFNMPQVGTSNTYGTWLPSEDGNFLVTVSQSSQMYGISSEIPVPLDVVFVIDTSGSMNALTSNGRDRADDVVTAANSAINTILTANDYNRVAVVAFSGSSGDDMDETTTVLSSLYHYTDGAVYRAASDHLTWSGSTVRGRNINGSSKNSGRNGHNGGTNIQAGIVRGAQILTNVTDTTVMVDMDGDGVGEKQMTRMPVLVVLSDGAPTFSSSNVNWKAPNGTNQGNGHTDRGVNPGEGFLAMLAAAYYKNAITENYYGDNAGAESASIYTIGVGLGNITRSNYTNTYSASEEATLANLTMNPSQWLGVSIGDRNNDVDDDLNAYWAAYQAKRAFTVQCGTYPNGTRDYSFQYSATSTQSRYNIDPSVTDLRYNDNYWAASSTEEINAAFAELVIEIQKRAITAPTLTDRQWGENYSGFVTFTDPIGEYMEVKDLVGVTDDGYLYQGLGFARLAEGYNRDWASDASTSAEQAAFNEALEQAFMDRIALSTAAGSATPTLEQVRAILDVITYTDADYAANGGDPSYDAGGGYTRTFDHDLYGEQLYYTSDSDYGNSFTWFGKVHYPEADTEMSANETYDVQFIGVAPKNADNAAWLHNGTNADRLADARAAGANCVVRSYFMYGTADGAYTDTADMLHFQVRVLTSLDEPHQQYVSVKSPASLLAVQRVLINDTDPTNLEAHYTDLVPTRVIYEVGLRSDIDANNVWQIVDEGYLSETLSDGSFANVDAEGNILFYTNDWDRTATEINSTDPNHAAPERALAHVNFEASPNNSFYRYETNTLLYDMNNRVLTSPPQAGQQYKYLREYYTWVMEEDGVSKAELKREFITVTAPADQTIVDAQCVQSGGQYYIRAGVYSDETLTEGDDIFKTANSTGTASIVSHPTRDAETNTPDYTTWLGNNGKLVFYGVKPKTVTGDDITTTDRVESDAVIDGKPVKVGDTLTYTITAANTTGETADITITDTIPAGTALVDGSITTMANGQPVNGTMHTVTGDKITWNLSNAAAGTQIVVSFKVTVLESAVSTGTVTNKANITVGSNSYETNITTNPVVGKQGLDAGGNTVTGVQVGDTVEFKIAFANTTGETADIVVKDKIPAGTTFSGETSHKAELQSGWETSGELVWTFENVAPGARGVITFEVVVDASMEEIALDPSDPNSVPALGVENTAGFIVGNNPEITTNTVKIPVDTGLLELHKEITNYSETPVAAAGKTFILNLVESTGKLNGAFVRSDAANPVIFTDGKASVDIGHGENLMISGLPVGVTITVTEVNVPGFTAAYVPASGSVVIAAGRNKVKVENTYAASAVEVPLSGTKTLINNDRYDQSKSFSFVLESTNADATVPGQATYDASVTVSAEAGKNGTGTFTFPNLTFTKAGEYYWLLSEVNAGASGITYSTAKYHIYVKVTDEGIGELKAEVKYRTANADGTWPTTWNTLNTAAADQLVFTNTFAPVKTSLELKATKVLTGVGVTLTDNQFSFSVVETEENGTTVKGQVATGQSKADGSVVFTGIEYDAAGTHFYTITEDRGTSDNMIYSGVSYRIKVEVTENNGVLNTELSLWNGSTWEPTSVAALKTALTFTNIYTGEYDVTLEAYKTLNGRDAEDREFNFVVSENGTTVTTGHNVAADNGVNKKIVFEPIGYELDDLTPAADNSGKYTGVFTYTISEVPGGDGEITYSPTTYTAEVTVTFDPATGWSSTVLYKDANGIQVSVDNVKFVNTHNPPPVEVDPQTLVPRLAKTVEGNSIPAGLTFSFMMYKAAPAMDGGVEIDDGYAVYDSNKDAAGNAAALVSIGASTPTAAGDTAANTNLVVDFNKLTFNKVGEYKLWVVEAGAGTNLHGVEYSKARYLLVVTVTRNADTGELIADGKYYTGLDGSWNVADYNTPADTSPNAPLAFVNKYEAKGSMPITAKKSLTGRALKPGMFSFTLTEKGTNNVHTGTNAADGTITFDTLFFTDTGFNGGYTKTLTYVMEEVPGNLAGVTYDKSKYELTIVLMHHGDGTIGSAIDAIKQTHDAEGNLLPTPVTVDLADGVVFNNSGAPYQGAELTFPVTKTLTGRDLKQDQFSFQIELVSAKDGMDANSADLSGVTLGVKDTVSNAAGAADGVAASMNLKLQYPANTPAGYYTYEVTEVNNHLAGVTYDGTKYVAVVHVHDGDQDGVLSAEVVSLKKVPVSGTEEPLGAGAAMAFANTYKPKEFTFNLIGQKTLTGRNMLDDQFDFEVIWDSYLKAGENTPVDMNDIRVATGSNAAAANGQPGTVTFTDITVSKTGVYTFIVRELPGSLKGVDYDTETCYKVDVTVTDNVTTGMLEAAFTVAKSTDGGATYGTPESYDVTADAAKLAFNNTYDAEDTELKLKASKTLTGRDMTAGEFAFEVLWEAYCAIGGNQLENMNGIRVAVAGNPDGTDGTAAEFTFSAIPYTKAGEYAYTVREIDPSAANVTIDGKAAYAVIVRVEDDTALGKLEITKVLVVGSSDDPSVNADVLTFKNKYTPDPVNTSFEVYKTLTGKKFDTETFKFSVSLTKDGVPQTLTTTELTVDNSGVATYPDYSYSEPDTYVWTIEEVTNTYTGTGTVAYDNAKYTITEVVEDDPATGKLVITSRAIAKDGAPAQIVHFTNSYTPAPVKQNLDLVLDSSGADKTLNGRDILAADNFTFEVKNLQGAVVAEGTSDVNGQISMDYDLAQAGVQTDGFTYTTAGTYTYTVTEKVGTSPAVTYDPAVWTVTIEVTYDNATGLLTAKDPVITAVKDTTAADTTDITFTNTYDPVDAVFAIQKGEKVLGGNRVTQIPGEFEFHILNAAGNVVAKGFNDADGNITFEALTFSAPTVAEFRIVEVDKGATGMTYSDVEYKLTVTVIDNPQLGKLEYSYKIEEGQIDVTDSWQFVNTYKGLPTEATVRAIKVLQGRELVDGEFTFTLTPAANNPTAVSITGGTNDADGNVAFRVEGLSEVGTYSFVMQEQGIDTDRMDYDDRTVEVFINVTDSGAGYLSAEVTYQTGDIPTFTNTYKPEAAPVTVQATKKLTGRDLKAGEFKFEIRDAQGMVLARGTNDADGRILFEEFKLEEGTGQVLCITEVDTNAKHVKYDKTTYYLTVDMVNKDGKGVLEAKVYYPNGGVVFNNKYQLPKEDPKPTEPTPLSPDTGDHTPFAMWIALLAASICGMAVLEKKRRAYRDN